MPHLQRVSRRLQDCPTGAVETSQDVVSDGFEVCRRWMQDDSRIGSIHFQIVKAGISRKFDCFFHARGENNDFPPHWPSPPLLPERMREFRSLMSVVDDKQCTW